ncbi:Ras GTPase-activating protein 1 [Branchiostoma belcheri]|nr:Ras GTPase-activating protein 1 [Branchiostoma belcheri]
MEDKVLLSRLCGLVRAGAKDLPREVESFTLLLCSRARRSKDAVVDQLLVAASVILVPSAVENLGVRASVFVPLSKLPNGQYVDEWYPVIPESPYKGDMGSIRIRAHYRSQLVLPLEEYAGLKQLIVSKEFHTIYALDKVCARDRSLLASALLRVFRQEKNEAVLLQTLTTKEIANEDESATLFRATTLASTLMDQYMKMTAVPFLHQAVKEVITKIADSKQSCEHPPSSLTCCVRPVKDPDTTGKTDWFYFTLQLGVQMYQLNPTKLEKGADVNSNLETLLSFLTEAVEAIFKATESCPSTLRYIFGCLQREVLKKWPDDTTMRTRVVSGFIFLRLICPAILNPRQFNLLAESPTPTAARTLTMVAKSLQNLANLVEFGAKEPYMEAVNPFIVKNKERMIMFLDELANVPSYPEVAEKVKSDPSQDLATLHQICLSHLTELQTLSTTQPFEEVAGSNRAPQQQTTTVHGYRQAMTVPVAAVPSQYLLGGSSYPHTERLMKIAKCINLGWGRDRHVNNVVKGNLSLRVFHCSACNQVLPSPKTPRSVLATRRNCRNRVEGGLGDFKRGKQVRQTLNLNMLENVSCGWRDVSDAFPTTRGVRRDVRSMCKVTDSERTDRRCFPCEYRTPNPKSTGKGAGGTLTATTMVENEGCRMAFSPSEAPVYGGSTIVAAFAEDSPLPEEHEFFLIFRGSQQRHITIARQLNSYTLQAVIPDHDCAETVEVSVCASDSVAHHQIIASGLFQYTHDKTWDMARQLADNSTNQDSPLDSPSAPHVQFDLVGEDVDTFDVQMTSAFESLNLPPGWNVLGTNATVEEDVGNGLFPQRGWFRIQTNVCRVDNMPATCSNQYHRDPATHAGYADGGVRALPLVGHVCSPHLSASAMKCKSSCGARYTESDAVAAEPSPARITLCHVSSRDLLGEYVRSHLRGTGSTGELVMCNMLVLPLVWMYSTLHAASCLLVLATMVCLVVAVIMLVTDPQPRETLLHFAARLGLRRLAAFLVEKPGAEAAIKLPNKDGDLPSDLAKKAGHDEVAALLTDPDGFPNSSLILCVSETREVTHTHGVGTDTGLNLPDGYLSSSPVPRVWETREVLEDSPGKGETSAVLKRHSLGSATLSTQLSTEAEARTLDDDIAVLKHLDMFIGQKSPMPEPELESPQTSVREDQDSWEEQEAAETGDEQSEPDFLEESASDTDPFTEVPAPVPDDAGTAAGIPTISVTQPTPERDGDGHSKILDENLRRLHNINEGIQRLREMNKRQFIVEEVRKENLSRLSCSCPDLNEGASSRQLPLSKDSPRCTSESSMFPVTERPEETSGVETDMFPRVGSQELLADLRIEEERDREILGWVEDDGKMTIEGVTEDSTNVDDISADKDSEDEEYDIETIQLDAVVSPRRHSWGPISPIQMSDEDKMATMLKR